MFRFVLFAGLCSHAFAQTWNCTNVLDWNFAGAKVTQNNLGGLGPNFDDKHEIRFSGVLADDSGKQIDMVVTADSSYKLHNNLMNGLWSNGSDAPGAFGQVNIMDNSDVTLKFSLVESGGDTPFAIGKDQKVLFSVYDLDRAPNKPEEHESVQFVTPVASYSIPANTTITLSGEASDGTLYAQSHRAGNAADNPVDPLKMSDLAEESKISVTYVGISSWEIRFGDDGGGKGGGRNVLVAGRSEGDCPCIGTSDWTLHENLKYNNLGGLGPVLTDPPELRYSNVFTTGWGKQPIDLVVKVAEGSAYSAYNTDRNGFWPEVPTGANQENTQMGQININSGSNSTFDFIFVKAGTDTPYSLSNVLFSVYDLDQNKVPSIHRGQFVENHEFVVFPEAVTNWTLTADPPTTVKESGSNADGTLQFTSTRFGDIADNPTNPLDLSPLQKASSVTVWYSDTSKFQVNFGHEYVNGIPKPKKHGGYGGRNVIFAGPGIYCPAPTPTTDLSARYLNNDSSNDSTAAMLVVFVAVAAVAGVAAAVFWKKQKQPQDVMIPIDTNSGSAYNSCCLEAPNNPQVFTGKHSTMV